MRLRPDLHDRNGFNDREYEIESVKANFDERRKFSAEGYEVEIGIDDSFVKEWVIIQEHINPLNEEKDVRLMDVPIDLKFNRGMYVIWRGEYWIIFSEKRYMDGAYWSVQIRKCNYLMKWIDKETGRLVSYWVVLMGKNPYSKGVWNNTFVQYVDSQMAAVIPSAPVCVKRATRDERRLISNNEINPKSFMISDIQDVVTEGCTVWNFAEDEPSPAYDDYNNMVADRFRYERVSETESLKDGVEITGNSEIYYDATAKYTAALYQDGDKVESVFSFALTDEKGNVLSGRIAAIINSGDDFCEIKVGEHSCAVVLSVALNTGEVCAEKRIMIRDIL